MQLSDGRDISTRINSTDTLPSFPATPCLASVGPSPVMSSSKTAFPLLSCVICPPPLFRLDGPFPISSSTYHLPHVPFPPRQPLTKLHPPRLLSCLLCLYPFFHMSSPYHLPHLSSFLLRPCSCGPITPLPNPTFRLGLHTRPSSYSVFPGGNARSLPYPKVLSWPDRPQSQERSY
jgi:hypothetical protein